MKKMVILKDVNNQKIQTLQKPDKKCKAFFILNNIFVSNAKQKNAKHFLSVFQFLFHLDKPLTKT
jgi:hypothetical protein